MAAVVMPAASEGERRFGTHALVQSFGVGEMVPTEIIRKRKNFLVCFSFWASPNF